MISKRDMSPGMYKTLKWFTRVLWIGMILVVAGSMNHAMKEGQRADEAQERIKELNEEVDDLKAKLKAAEAQPKMKKPDGGTLP